MIKESGRIVAIEDDCLWVETIRQSTCNSCSARKGCGHSLLNKVSEGRRHHVRVLLGSQSAADFIVDDQVDISIPEQVLVGGALLVYMLPLITMLAAATLVSQWWPGDVPAFLGAVAGFVLGIGVVRLHGQLNRNNRALQPIVLGKTVQSNNQAVQWV